MCVWLWTIAYPTCIYSMRLLQCWATDMGTALPHSKNTYTHCCSLPFPLMSNTSPITATPPVHVSATRLKRSQYNVAITHAIHPQVMPVTPAWSEDVTDGLYSDHSWGKTFRNVSQMEGCCLWHNVDSSIFCSQDLKLHFCHCKLSATHHQSLRQCFLAERTRGATKNCVRFSYPSEKACSGWMAGGESREFISGLQTKTSQSLNLQMPPTTRWQEK